MQLHANAALYAISAIATGKVTIRPWRFQKQTWAVPARSLLLRSASFP